MMMLSPSHVTASKLAALLLSQQARPIAGLSFEALTKSNRIVVFVLLRMRDVHRCQETNAFK